jgi:AhpD family alkylhydroperoxidase
VTGRFEKRIFTPGLFLDDVAFLLTHAPSMIGAARNDDLSRSFVEKIMAVTTAVNECTYCAWYHAKAAVASGISAEEVRSLFDLQFHATATDFELPALLYAQHYAETDRQPEAAMTAHLSEAYGERTATDIRMVIRMISFGNLFGNTWDAVLSRFRGRPAPQGNVPFELAFFLLSFWFMFPAMGLMRSERGSRGTPVRDGSRRTR